MVTTITSNESTAIKQFTINTEIEHSTFSDLKFLTDVKKYLESLHFTISDLDQATFLRDVFYMGNHVFNQLVEKKKSSREINKQYINWIQKYHKFLARMNPIELHPNVQF